MACIPGRVDKKAEKKKLKKKQKKKRKRRKKRRKEREEKKKCQQQWLGEDRVPSGTSQQQWLRSVILATWETEAGGLQVKAYGTK